MGRLANRLVTYSSSDLIRPVAVRCGFVPRFLRGAAGGFLPRAGFDPRFLRGATGGFFGCLRDFLPPRLRLGLRLATRTPSDKGCLAESRLLGPGKQTPRNGSESAPGCHTSGSVTATGGLYYLAMANR